MILAFILKKIFVFIDFFYYTYNSTKMSLLSDNIKYIIRLVKNKNIIF